MRVPIGLLLAAFCLTAVLVAQQQATQGDLNALKTSTNPTNTHLVRALAQQAQDDLGGQNYRNAVQQHPSNLSNAGNTLNYIATQAQGSQRTYDTGNLILKGNDLLVKGSIAAGFLLAPVTGGMSLAVSAVGSAADLGLGKVEDLYQKAADDSMRRNLKTQLDQYEQKFGEDAYKQLTSSADPAQFRDRLEEKLGDVFGGTLDALPKDQQDIVNHFYEKEIADVMKAGFSTLSDVQELQQSEIDQNRKDIKGLALTFAQFADSTNAQLASIVNSQNQLSSDLQNLNNRIGATEQGVAFMQSVMFSNMKPAEQLAALKSGLFPDMPEDQRKDLEEKVKVVAERQELTDKVADYLNGASEITNIAHNLGVDPNIINTANTAIAIGNQAMNAFTDFSSGNFLGGMSAISNVFGIGGPDVAAQRHAEIMNMLGKMYTKLDVIDQKVNKLLQGQQLILQTQQTILQNIDSLSRQVQANQAQVMTELHSLHDDVLVNRQIITDQATLKYGNCFELVKNPTDGSVIIDTSRGQYPSFTRFQKLYTDRKQSLLNCMEQLAVTRGARQEFNSIFWLNSWTSSADSTIPAYLQSVYAPAWELLQNTALNGDGKTVEQRVSSLLAPMDTVTDFNAKYAGIEAVDPPRFRKPLSELMGTALATPAVILHDGYLANIHYYFLMLDGNDQPRPLDDLYKGDNIRDTGYDYLVEALSVTDIAIAQQVLASGDSLLPVLAEGVRRFQNSNDANEQATYKQISDLLKSDSVLAANLVKFMLRDEVRVKCNFITYDVALTATDPAMLKSCTEDFWKLNYSDKEERDQHGTLKTPKGWSVDIGDTLYALPTAEDLFEGRFTYTDEAYQLLGWRERLLQEISTYEVYNRVSASHRSDVNSVILQEFASLTKQGII